MSLLYDSRHNVFVRDLWPGGIGRRQGDDEHAADAPLWKVMPDSFDALCSWLVVERRTPPFIDPTRRHIVQYTPHLEAPNPTFMFKVQGVLQHFQVNTLGSWNQREVGASKAARSVTLSSGSRDEPFETQRAFVRHLKEFVIRTLDPKVVDIAVESRPTIYFRENVFTRVRPDMEHSRCQLTAMDDPHGNASRIASRWAVTRKIAMQSVLPSGQLAPASVLQFHLGDFVEVEAAPDIVTTYQNHKLKVEVFLVPVAMTRLCSASEASMRGGVHLLTPPTTTSTATIPTPPAHLPSNNGPLYADGTSSKEYRAALHASYFSHTESR